MVYHVGNPEFPFAQAFYPTRGWPRRIELDDDRFVVPAGRYGVYAFPLDEFNLLPLTL